MSNLWSTLVIQRNAFSKVVPDWNDWVERHFREALFWHKIWVENDRPKEGLLFNIRQKN